MRWPSRSPNKHGLFVVTLICAWGCGMGSEHAGSGATGGKGGAGTTGTGKGGAGTTGPGPGSGASSSEQSSGTTSSSEQSSGTTSSGATTSSGTTTSSSAQSSGTTSSTSTTTSSSAQSSSGPGDAGDDACTPLMPTTFSCGNVSGCDSVTQYCLGGSVQNQCPAMPTACTTCATHDCACLLANLPPCSAGSRACTPKDSGAQLWILDSGCH